MVGSSTDSPDQPVFYYDLGGPQCYMVAETIMATLPVVPEWEPVLGVEVAAIPADPGLEERAGIERRAAELGLQPIRWPRTWPPDTEQAMLAATYAKNIGRAVAFSLAAFRQAFAGGRDLGDENTVLIAGAACEMHPVALRKGIDLASTKTALQAATRRAQQAGATDLPAIQVGDRIFTGSDAVMAATTALQAARR
jgi:2-hydroxychromene-2-carboxylate isomerase